MLYQFAVLEGIEHLNVTTALKAVEIRHMLPEPIYSSQVEQSLGVDLPCIPANVAAAKISLSAAETNL